LNNPSPKRAASPAERIVQSSRYCECRRKFLPCGFEDLQTALEFIVKRNVTVDVVSN
jgi:hypothetical protein